MTNSPSLRSELDELHAQYVELINLAVAAGNDDNVSELVAGYDEAATRLVAEREGRTDLLPLRRAANAPRSRLQLSLKRPR